MRARDDTITVPRVGVPALWVAGSAHQVCTQPPNPPWKPQTLGHASSASSNPAANSKFAHIRGNA